MQALAEAFGRVELGSVLHQLWAAGRAWSEGRLVTSIDPFDRVEAGNPIFYAAVAETVRHALYWCLCRRVADSGLLLRSVRTWAEVEPLVRLAWSVQLNEPFVGRPELAQRFHAESFMSGALRMVLPQGLPQRRSPFSIGRALMLLDEAPRRRAARLPRFDAAALAAQVERALGCDLPTFVTAVAQLSGAAAHREVLSIATLVSPDLRLDEPLWFGKGVRRPAVGRALDLLAQDAEALRRDHPEPRAMIEAPNPLLARPLVRLLADHPDVCFAPLPHLVPEWLYEPLMEHLFQHAAGDSAARERLDDAFEEYVGLLAQRCCPDDARWLPEQALTQPGCRVVDWALPLRDSVVLLEVKRHAIPEGVRFRGEPGDWRATQRTWRRGVEQLRGFWARVEAGQVDALRAHRHKTPLPVLVTFGEVDLAAGNEPWLTELGVFDGEGLRPILMSVLALEEVLTRWSASGDVEALPAMLRDIGARGLPTWRRAQASLEPTGPLWDALEALVERVVAGRGAGAR